MNNSTLYYQLEDVIVKSGWNHKILISQFDIYMKRIRKRKIIANTLSVLTSVSVTTSLVNLFHNNNISLWITLVISIMSASASIFTKNEDINKEAIYCKQYAEKFLQIKEKCISDLYKISGSKILNDSLEKEIYHRHTKILMKMDILDETMPFTSQKSVSLASFKIKKRFDNDISNDYKFFIPFNLIKERIKDDSKY